MENKYDEWIDLTELCTNHDPPSFFDETPNHPSICHMKYINLASIRDHGPVSYCLVGGK